MKTTRRVLITGVTHGIGEALAKWLIDQGHVVYGCGRSKERIEQWSQQVGSPHDFQVVDVTDEDAVQKWCRRLQRSVPVPELVINNAAVIHDECPFVDLPAEEFDRVVEVNVLGVARVARAFLPWLLRERAGVLVNISSGWGRSVSPGVSAYCTSKWAVEGFSRALASEVGPGVGVVAVNPGIINTAMLRQCWGSRAREFPKPEVWAEVAGPFFLKLTVLDNGKSMDIPVS